MYASIQGMNTVQVKISELEKKGWTLAAIASEIGVSYNAAQKWKAGDRYPANTKAVLRSLDVLERRRRIPRKRRTTVEMTS